MRIEKGITRGAAVTIRVDGRSVPAFAGETVAAAMLAAGQATFRLDRSGRPRGLFCNMGTCSECIVAVEGARGRRRMRACLTIVEDGLVIETGVIGETGVAGDA